jgi:hypothetical protein
MKINRENVKWCARVMAIILAASVADALVVMFMRRPFPWTVIIPAFIPVLVAAFVIVPMNRTAKR